MTNSELDEEEQLVVQERMNKLSRKLSGKKTVRSGGDAVTSHPWGEDAVKYYPGGDAVNYHPGVDAVTSQPGGDAVTSQRDAVTSHPGGDFVTSHPQVDERKEEPDCKLEADSQVSFKFFSI